MTIRTLLKQSVATPLKLAIIEWWQRDAFTQSAAVAYYTIFSFPALIILYFASASLFIDDVTLKDQVYSFLSENFGQNSSQQFQEIIQKTAPQETSFWAFALGGSVLLFTGLRLFMQLQKALNQIWEVNDKELSNLRKLVIRRINSFGVMLGIGFTLVVSMLATSTLTLLTEWIMRFLPDYFAYLFHSLNLLLSLGLLTAVFTLLLKKLPDTYVKWPAAFKGAIVSALLFLLGEYGLGIYFSLAQPESAYGVTGSIILLMIWVSYSCVILLLGAEVSKQYHLMKYNYNGAAKDSVN